MDTGLNASRRPERVKFLGESGDFPGGCIRVKNALGPRSVDLANGFRKSLLRFVQILSLNKFPEFFHTGFDQGPDAEVPLAVRLVLRHTLES